MEGIFFKQRNFLVTRSFKFESNGVRVLVQGFLKSENALIPFEYISIDPYEKTMFSGFSAMTLMTGVLFTIFSIAMLFSMAQGHGKNAFSSFWVYFVSSLVSFVLFYLQRVQLVIYGQGEKLRLVLYKNRPNKQKFEAAIHKIQAAKIKYLRETYLNNKVINMPTLNWLRSLGAVKQEEIERILNIPPILGDSAQ